VTVTVDMKETIVHQVKYEERKCIELKKNVNGKKNKDVFI